MEKSYIIDKVITIGMLITIIGVVISPWIINPGFESFQISDWMISYHDGFIRRGLAGSILFFIHNNFINISPIYTVLLLDTVSFIVFLCIIINIFRIHKWSLATALFPIASCMATLAEYRRDFMMLCLCYITYVYFFNFLKKKHIKYLLLSIIMMSISILLYEPIFFVLIPIMIMQYWYSINYKYIKKIIYISTIFLMPILCMFLSCIYNGTIQQANSIWNSWLPIIRPFMDNEIKENAMAFDFLQYNIIEIFKYHITINFGTTLLEFTASIIVLIFVFLCVYYLCTNIPIIKEDKNIHLYNYNKQIGNILLFQLIIQIPLFSILSCDYGRNIPFGIFTTLFIYHLSNTHKITIYVIPMIERLNNSIDNMIKRMNILKYYPMYCIIMLLFPLRIWSTPYIYDNIIYHLFIRLNKYILY